ncbi:hypothetical protein Dimus_010784 [Dionaea muscipula]
MLQGILKLLGKGVGHVEESFQAMMDVPTRDASGAGSSGTQKEKKKRAPRNKKDEQAVGEQSSKATSGSSSSGFAPAQLPMDASLVDTPAILDVGEGVVIVPVKRKRQLVKKSEGEAEEVPKLKKAKFPRDKEQRKEFIASMTGEPTGLWPVEPSDVPEREGRRPEQEVETNVDASMPTTAEMDQNVEDIIVRSREQPFIS